MSLKTASIFFLILVVVGAGAAYLWVKGRSTQGLTVELFAPPQISVGTPFDLEVTLTNNSSDILQDGRLAVELPDGMALVGSAPEQTLENKSIGTIDADSVTRQKFSLIVLEGENTVKTVKARVSYLPTSLRSRFERSSSLDLAVGAAGLTLEVSAPQKVFSGEEFEVTVEYRNVSATGLENLRLALALPAAFTRTFASANPEKNSTVWNVPTLAAGAEGALTLKGTLAGPDNAFFEIGAAVEATFGGRRYAIAKQAGTVAIAPSPVSLSLQANGSTDTIAVPGADLQYTLSFVNNTDIGLKDVVIRAKLTGEMFNLSTLSSKAFFQQADRTLVWNASVFGELATIPPGASGSVDFAVKVAPQYPGKKLSDKNFTLDVSASIESPTVPYYVASQKTITVANLVTKIAGATVVDARGVFRDAAAGVVNSGVWPMKVGQSTQFTIHWVVTNYATDVSSVRLKAFLGPNVKFVKMVKSSTAVQPTYNTNTQEIEWSLGQIAANKGVVGAPHEAIFQVEATPSISDVGKSMTLLQATQLTATDLFTNQPIASQDAPVTTGALSDPTVTASETTVQP